MIKTIAILFLYSFLSSVPSQLSCYLLKLVYGIISVHSVPPSANASNPNDSISNSTITIVTKNNAENHDHLHDVFGDLFRSTSKSENEKEADNTAKVSAECSFSIQLFSFLHPMNSSSCVYFCD